MLIVQKFGGTSVGSVEAINRSATLALDSARLGHRIVVVTSAMSGVTSELVGMAQRAAHGDVCSTDRARLFDRHAAVARELIPNNTPLLDRTLESIDQRLDRLEKLCFGLSMVHELTPRLLDAISGTGEMLSAPLLAAAIEGKGGRSVAVEATEVIVTDDEFGNAEPLMPETGEQARKRLAPLLDESVIPVVTGFIGATSAGVVTTLGRGGSDYSATILGAALAADEVWIWTDVNGVMTANPAEVPEARTIREISYNEASELAYYGAKIIHHKTILPVFKHGIPIRILNSFNPADPGTRISANGQPSPRGVKAVTSIRNVSLISITGKDMQGIPGIAARAFAAVASERANVLMISQASSENNICLVVMANEAQRVVKALRRALEIDLLKGHIDETIADDTVAVIAAVGDKMKGAPGIAGRLFGALGAANINIIAISQGSSELNISLVVEEHTVAEAVRAIHAAFQLEQI